jgi:hypothetical protein
VFWLTVAPRGTFGTGVPVFSGVPRTGAEDVLRRHGMKQSEVRLLDAERDVTLTKWVRS